MRRNISKFFVGTFFALFLVGCGSVDQFQSRIYDANLNSQNALNQETLLNIVRASRYQSLNFVAITQVAGSQQETLSTGLPTIAVGPHQTAAEHIYQISNSVSSQVAGSYQSNPLVSTTFQTGLLSPISKKNAALLVASHPREIVFFAILDSISVSSSGGKRIARLTNNPDLDYDNDDPSITPDFCRNKYNNFTREDVGSDQKSPAKGPSLFPGTRCGYSKFSNLLKTLVQYGLTVELTSDDDTASAVKSDPSANSGSAAANTIGGRLCIDGSVYTSRIRGIPYCAEAKPKKLVQPARTITSSKKVTLKEGDKQTETQTGLSETVPGRNPESKTLLVMTDSDGPVSIDVTFRSPLQVYTYLGGWLRNDRYVVFGDYVSRTAEHILRAEEPYLNVREGIGPGCYTSILYGSQLFCVPQESYHTAALIDILQNLRNLSIQPSDLNSAFTVRLSGQ